MSNELRRNPDSGDVERKVVSYEKVKRAQLEAEQNEAQTQVDEGSTRVKQLEESLKAEQDLQSQRETRLSDSKSELADYDALPDGPGHDSGSEGASGQEPSPESAENTDDVSSEPVGDSGDGSGEVKVSVTKEVDPLDEY